MFLYIAVLMTLCLAFLTCTWPYSEGKNPALPVLLDAAQGQSSDGTLVLSGVFIWCVI